jgi:putative hydrolase of the HAD superfamily
MEKVAVFDADGVVVLNQPRFSVALAQKQNIPEEKVLEFINGPMIDCVLGKRDLKEALIPYLSEWKWQGSVESLLDFWFKGEAKLNQDLISLIKTAKAKGISCYLATNQERYRTKFFADELGFLHLFDHMFVSSEIGAKKPQEKFYRYLIDSITYLDAIDSPGQIYFWDDRPGYVKGAANLGISASLYKSIDQVKSALDL